MLKPINVSQTELQMSRLALGMWRIHTISPSDIDRLMSTALDQGITTFDHADIYGGYTCEEAFGHWMKENKGLRDELQLVSKCGIKLISENRPDHRVKHYDTSKKHIKASVENSLKNLQTDYLDLLLIHRPDPLMNAAEVAEAFTELSNEGKVNHFGVSNFSQKQFDLLNSACDKPLVTNQIEISIFNNEPMFNGLLDSYQQAGFNSMAWSPLGGVDNIQKIITNERMVEIAESYSLTVGDLILVWLLNHPSEIIPVIGTMNTDRIKSAAASVDVKLDKQDWFEMLEIVRGHRVA